MPPEQFIKLLIVCGCVLIAVPPEPVAPFCRIYLHPRKVYFIQVILEFA